MKNIYTLHSTVQCNTSNPLFIKTAKATIKIFVAFFVLVMSLFGHGSLLAQPGAMSINQDVSGTYTNSGTVLRGGVFQFRIQENASGTASGTRNWQFNADSYF
ncbi:MAG TPA: hypothetical protein PLD84_05635, partial [Chitinophagales bacterium]|nr:hypothetical protein [Chitinophagales bacterium]